MANYKARNKTLLDNHLATGTETTYTYTPTNALDMKNDYHEITVLIRGKATAALTMQMKINAETDYNNAEITLDTTTISGSVNDAASNLTILPIGILDGAKAFYIRATIIFNDATDTLMFQSIGAAPHEGIKFNHAENQAGSTTTITSIQILVSTSTWIAGTEISIFGLRR